MPRTTAHRAALAAALVTPLLLPLWAAGPARAHGAPTDPVSRVVACSPEGGARAVSAACRAAVAANGAPFTAWDNLRVANVDGRDRQVVPDGKLCSGGLPGYKGLDLARADWPATRMTPGETLTMRYVSTIPHTGTFRMYLTKPGYDPAGPLSWSDLPEKPFAEVTDPALTDGAYRVEVTLPSDRTGRHVLYTVWQNSSTPDTYYSCSDVVFPDKTEKKENEKEEQGNTPLVSNSGPASEPTPGPASEPTFGPASESASGPSTPMLAGGAAAVLLLTGGAALAVRLRRR
ncbi:lytic polysaccharide monooxygenase auxiliary activity family 9 protein [Streptomyces swartbergensis]|uniref:lytic polysaccharide monooxygenase auxiliary activity family 9 protein n=1 Tax=Streptomyces swartbergensis TaxID=487165 RepID=UPI003811CB6D